MAIRLGLRFHQRDIPRLGELAAQIRNGEMQGSASTYEQAIVSARTGEPLEVYCDDPMEVVQMAAGYVVLGVSQPVIEELSQG